MLYYIVIGRALEFLSCLIAVFLHEMGHSRAGYVRGFKLNRIILMPYGAMLYGNEKMSGRDGMVIAVAGPIVSGSLAVITLALWWLIPESHRYTEAFFWANVSIFLFNILPCFPLDGSRVILSLFKSKTKALKMLKIFGVIIGTALIGLGIWSFWYKFNISLIISGCFLIVGAITGSKKEMYNHITSTLPFVKDYDSGVISRIMYLSDKCKLFHILENIKANKITHFIIVDSEGSVITEFDEQVIKEILIEYPLVTPISDILPLILKKYQ